MKFYNNNLSNNNNNEKKKTSYERRLRVARDESVNNSSFLSTLQASRFHNSLMMYESIV